MEIKFDIVGVCETWDSFENPIKTNIDIPGYSFFSVQSHSQNGGVGLYVKTGLSPIVRPDLSKDSADYVAVWVEVENVKEKNFLFCCLYRHPNSNPDNLSTYLREVLSNPAVSNKQIFLLGDFNLALLNHDSHTGTGVFVNLLLSKQFLPYIVHPT